MTSHTILTGEPVPEGLTDAGNGRGCVVCGGWTTQTGGAGRRMHPTCATDEPEPEPGGSSLGAELVATGCARAARQLRWIYTVTYRRRLRLPGVRPNTLDADQTACQELRHHVPIVLARHLPGIVLVEWMDPDPAVIDSTWTLLLSGNHGWSIDLYWDYHPDWTVGDPTAITIWHEHANDDRDDSDGAVRS